MKKILIVFLVVVAGLFGLSLIRDIVLKSVITVVATQVTGAPVHIGGLSLGLVKQTAKVSGFKMYNPKGFPRGVMLDLPRIFVDLDLFSIFKGALHIQKIDLQLREVKLVKNREGKLNVDSLSLSQGQKGSKKPGKQLDMRIDAANLDIGRVISIDYSAPKPQVLVYDINLKKSYKNINSTQQLIGLAISEPLKAAGIQGLGIYGAAMLTGIGFIPVAATAFFIDKDYAAEELDVSLDRIFNVSLAVLKESGQIIQENKLGGEIKASVYDADVALKLEKISGNKTKITISARKYMFPKREIASGVLYQIDEKLK